MVYHPKLNLHRLPAEAYDQNLVIKTPAKKAHGNNSLLITVAQQAIAASALIWGGHMIGGADAISAAEEATKHTLILTGALNAPRSILWAAAHSGVKKWSQIATLKSQFQKACLQINKQFAELRKDHTAAMHLDNAISAKQDFIEKKQKEIDTYGFKYTDRNLAHTKVNIAGTLLGAVCYIPMTLHGGHDFIHAVMDQSTPVNAEAWKSLINGEFIGGGGTLLAYMGWSKRFVDAHHHLEGQFKKYAKQERTPDDNSVNKYNPNIGIRFANYRERAQQYSDKTDLKSKWRSFTLKAKDVMFEWTPLVLFMAKGGAFISEGGAPMVTSGTFFGLSGINEIQHEKGHIIKGAWHKAQRTMIQSDSPLQRDLSIIMYTTDIAIDQISESISKVGAYIQKQARALSCKNNDFDHMSPVA